MGGLRQVTIDKFRQSLAQPNSFLVGAAVGSGVTAQAAERGGADMLVTLNAGRFRMMGVSSMAAMLPIRDSNQLVEEFGCTEIVNRTSLPVIYGASWRGNRSGIDAFVKHIHSLGFSGISNFPTMIHYSEPFQQILEQAGLGFDQELELLKLGQKNDLCGVAYVGSSQQARAAAQAGIDVICMNFGFNTGGVSGVASSMSLLDVAARTHEFIKIARSWNPGVICLLEGGPIEKAEDMIEISKEARVDGYIGGSTIELFPMDYSVAETTAGFKMTRMLHDRIENLEKKLATIQLNTDLIGGSREMTHVINAVSNFASDPLPVLISGPQGSGRTRVANAICHHRAPSDAAVTFGFDTTTNEQRAMSELFGIASNRGQRRKVKKGLVETVGEGTLIIENIEQAPKRIQDRLVMFADNGRFKRVYGRKFRHSRAKVILTCGNLYISAGHDIDKSVVNDNLHSTLEAREIILPALKNRIGDIPGLVARFAEINTANAGLAPLELTPAATRELMAYDWPGNLAELEKVVKNLQADNAFGKLDTDAVDRALHHSQSGSILGTKDNGERIWILQALRRNGFRRSNAAKELGMSRKTLYNKIKRYRILG